MCGTIAKELVEKLHLPFGCHTHIFKIQLWRDVLLNGTVAGL
jgi:hypothetical protein